MYVHRYAKYNHFSIDFAIFTKALPTNGRTDGRTDQWTDIPSYRDAIAASKNDDFLIDFAIFTKALPTDQQANQQTDIPSYRDTIAASKKHNDFIHDSITHYFIVCKMGKISSICLGIVCMKPSEIHRVQ